MNQTIENLRIPLTLLVIICHAGVNLPAAVVFRTEIAALAVPAFFVISGYLFFLKASSFGVKKYFEKLGKRVNTLLLPYLIWVPLYLLFRSFGLHRTVMQLLHDYGYWNIYWKALPVMGGVSPLSQLFDLSRLWFDSTSYGPFYGPFWYVEHLLLLALLSPVIYHFCKYLPTLFLGGLTVLYLLGVGIPYSPMQVVAILFFSVGAALAIHKKEIAPLHGWQRWTLLVIAVLYFGALLYTERWHDVHWFVRQGWLLIGVAAIIHLFDGWSIQWKWYQALVPCSFFVYAAHLYLVPYSYSDKLAWLWQAPWAEGLCFVLRPILIYLALAGIYYLLNRYLPFVLRLLTGSR